VIAAPAPEAQAAEEGAKVIFSTKAELEELEKEKAKSPDTDAGLEAAVAEIKDRNAETEERAMEVEQNEKPEENHAKTLPLGSGLQTE